MRCLSYCTASEYLMGDLTQHLIDKGFVLQHFDDVIFAKMKNNDDVVKSRIELTDVANNFFPIEKIRVGPGLNQGFGSESTGGFHQADTLEYAKPRSLDELRSKINQKENEDKKTENQN